LDIRLRRETVDRVVQGKQYSEILDIGCGDGSISTPLLNSQCRLTLLDVSPGMLSIARSRVSEELLSRVKFVNQDFMEVPFEKNFFDLVICVGVLAHVVSPRDLIAKIASVLKPGGTLILECTNGYHFLDRLNQLRNHLAWLFHPPKYRMNILSATTIRKTAEQQVSNRLANFVMACLSPARADSIPPTEPIRPRAPCSAISITIAIDG